MKRLVIHAVHRLGDKRAENPQPAAMVDALERWLSVAGQSTTERAVPFVKAAILQLPEVGLVQVCLETSDESESQGGLTRGSSPAPPAATVSRSHATPIWLSVHWLNTAAASVTAGPQKQLVMGQPLASELQRLPCDVVAHLQSKEIPPVYPPCIGGRSQEITSVVAHVRATLHCLERGSAAGALMGMVIVGRRGSGKSVMAEVVGQTLAVAHQPTRASSSGDTVNPTCLRSAHVASRGELSGQRAPAGQIANRFKGGVPHESPVSSPVWVGLLRAEAMLDLPPPAALARLRAALRRAVVCAPSLLILDDLHHMFPNSPHAGGALPLAEAAAEMLASLSHDCRRPPVALLATATAMEDLHPALQAVGLFDTALPLVVPDSRTRRLMLRALANRRGVGCSPSLLRMSASLTEGFIAADLARLIDGATLAVAARNLLAAPGMVGLHQSWSRSQCWSTGGANVSQPLWTASRRVNSTAPPSHAFPPDWTATLARQVCHGPIKHCSWRKRTYGLRCAMCQLRVAWQLRMRWRHVVEMDLVAFPRVVGRMSVAWSL